MSTLNRTMLGVIGCVMLSGAVHADMTGHGGLVKSIAVSPDGRQVLTASFDYSARLWQLDDHTLIRRLDGHDGPVNDGVFLAGGRHAATVGTDGKLIVWNLQNGAPLRVRQAHQSRAMALSATADGTDA